MCSQMGRKKTKGMWCLENKGRRVLAKLNAPERSVKMSTEKYPLVLVT